MMKQRIWMRKGMFMLLLCVGMYVLTGCGSKLDEAFDEASLTAAAEQVAELLQAKDYEAVVGMLEESIRESLPAESLQQAWEPLADNAGAFVDYSSSKIVPQKEKQATVILICNHENAKIQLTLTFDTELRLTGLYMK